MIRVVAFEGIDAVGKTTVARLVAKKLGCPLIGLPTEDMRLADHALLCDVSSRARYLYYLAAAVRLGEWLDAQADGVVVLDRYIDSVHAMHAPLHEELATVLRGVAVRQPDLVFLLEACEEARRRRLRDRGRLLDPYEERLLDDGFRNRAGEEYRRRADAVIIDTSELSVEDVAGCCLATIHRADHR